MSAQDALRSWCLLLRDVVELTDGREASLTVDGGSVHYRRDRGAVFVGDSGLRLDIPESWIDRVGLVVAEGATGRVLAGEVAASAPLKARDAQ